MYQGRTNHIFIFNWEIWQIFFYHYYTQLLTSFAAHNLDINTGLYKVPYPPLGGEDRIPPWEERKEEKKRTGKKRGGGKRRGGAKKGKWIAITILGSFFKSGMGRLSKSMEQYTPLH